MSEIINEDEDGGGKLQASTTRGWMHAKRKRKNEEGKEYILQARIRMIKNYIIMKGFDAIFATQNSQGRAMNTFSSFL